MFTIDFVVRYYRTSKNGVERCYYKEFDRQDKAYKYYCARANELGHENVLMYRRETTTERPAYTDSQGRYVPAVEYVQIHYLR